MLRKARKSYPCANCKTTIEKGTQYWSIESSIAIGGTIKQFVSSRICLICYRFLKGK